MDRLQGWLKQVEGARKGADLSRDEDLSIAVMNLISLEEHFFFTAQKTGDRKYLDMLKEVREVRKEMLGKLVRGPQGEEWCISKHLLAGSMRLIEVGTKELAGGKEAETYFRRAFELWSLFFALKLKMVQGGEIAHETDKGAETLSMFSKMVKKIVDCCRE